MDEMKHEWLEQMAKDGRARSNEIRSMATELMQLRSKFNDTRVPPTTADARGVMNRKKCEMAAELINDALYWENTEEGSDYWSRVYRSLSIKARG